jgi:4-hydroxy-2-oxoheptanedioate aldolase
MGMSMGHPDAHDPPYPAEMQDARARVLAACKANGIRFLNAVRPNDIVECIDEGVMVCAAGRGGEEAARIGRAHSKRSMPV